MASAQDARALATDKQEHVFIYLFIYFGIWCNRKRAGDTCSSAGGPA